MSVGSIVLLSLHVETHVKIQSAVMILNMYDVIECKIKYNSAQTAVYEKRMNQIKTASFLFVTATLIYINFTEIKVNVIIMMIMIIFVILSSDTGKRQNECIYKHSYHLFFTEDLIRT